MQSCRIMKCTNSISLISMLRLNYAITTLTLIPSCRWLFSNMLHTCHHYTSEFIPYHQKQFLHFSFIKTSVSRYHRSSKLSRWRLTRQKERQNMKIWNKEKEVCPNKITNSIAPPPNLSPSLSGKVCPDFRHLTSQRPMFSVYPTVDVVVVVVVLVGLL